jgi:hypothetical protein
MHMMVNIYQTENINKYGNMGSEVLTARQMKIIILWDDAILTSK